MYPGVICVNATLERTDRERVELVDYRPVLLAAMSQHEGVVA